MLAAGDQTLAAHLLGVLGMLAPMHVAERLDVWILTRCAERNDRPEIGTLGPSRTVHIAVFASREWGLIGGTTEPDAKRPVVIPEPADFARLHFCRPQAITWTGFAHSGSIVIVFVKVDT